MEFTEGDQQPRRGDAFTPSREAAGTSPTHQDDTADTCPPRPVAWGDLELPTDASAVRQVVRDAARASLDEDIRPIDLSKYETTPDAGVLAGAGADAAGVAGRPAPGTGPRAASRVSELKSAITTAGRATSQLGSGPLHDLAADLLEIGERSERALVFVLADATTRGDVRESDSGSPRQWLTDLSPHLEPGQASRIVTAADAINQPRNAPLRAALDAGEISVRALVVALREVEKAHPVLPEATRLDVLGYYLPIAHQGTSADLKDLTKRIVEKYGEDDPEKESKARSVESLRWFELAGGMTRIQGELSPGHAAMFASAIEALASPRRKPSEDDATDGNDPDHSGPGEVDSLHDSEAPVDRRTIGKRRADALMEIINAMGRLTDGDAGKSAARVGVTIPLSVLVGSLIGAGHGTTTLGHTLDASTCRTMACSAQLVPMVLGTRSEPLDIGRAAHPFSTATRTAIIHRDRAGCTFPGCDRPAPWCEVHHAVPWWVGGHSDLTNGTLLCSRHHHIVHTKGYLPWISATAVIWDLTPGRMPTQRLAEDDPLVHGPGAPPDYLRTA